MTVLYVIHIRKQFISYLADGELPEDEILARQIKCRAKAYTIINGELYKRSVCGIFQCCIEPEERSTYSRRSTKASAAIMLPQEL